MPLSSTKGGVCGPVVCDSKTCSYGCCDGKVCVTPSNDYCGFFGEKCLDCTAGGASCHPTKGDCFKAPNCGAYNCNGCCTFEGKCQSGTSDSECGSDGMICGNCTQLGPCVNKSCAPVVPACNPVGYGGCYSSLTTPAPNTVANGCSQADLQMIAQICPSFGESSTCKAFIQKLLISNPSCATCMSQFTAAKGDLVCAAPYMDKACNHYGACAIGCVQTACDNCLVS